jgi:[CysO sulfur-carrier protein]-S-L-cysteine hydrolase
VRGLLADMKIPAELLGELVAHALEDPENEVCGVVAVAADESPSAGGARAVGVRRARNVHVSPLKFEIEPAELLALYNAIEREGNAFGAIYHSHVHSEPYPSQTDINFAAGWPGLEWIIVGLAERGRPDVRSYVIDQGRVREVALAQGAR